MGNKDVEKAMLKMMAGLKEMRDDLEEKRIKRDWAEITIPMTLHEALSRFRKYELDDIRKQLDITNASSLKKGELITLLQDTIPSVLEKLCLEMDEERFGFLAKMARKGGYIHATNLEKPQIGYFQKNGLVYTGTFQGKRVLVLPTELINLLLTLEKNQVLMGIIRRNTEWIKLTRGLLYYNGTLTLMEIKRFIKTYSSEPPIYFREYMEFMHHADSYRTEYYVDTEGYSNIRVLDPKKVKQEQRMRKDLSFYPFTKEQLLEAGELEFVDRNKSYQQLVKFILDNYEIGRNEADGMVEECVYAIKNGDVPGKILEYLGSRLEFEGMEFVQALMDHVVYLMNNTKAWFLKGYTPIELGEKDKPIPQPSTTPSEKVGRNDPCSCGSGKKYKKCCGR